MEDPKDIENFINEQKIAFSLASKAREGAECRRAEDMGQTVADIMDCLGNFRDNSAVNVAEIIVDNIVNGEIAHVFWNNEK